MIKRPPPPPTHTHICSRKDTGQRVDPALYGFQHAPLGGHVLLGCHGNTKQTERKELRGDSQLHACQNFTMYFEAEETPADETLLI